MGWQLIGRCCVSFALADIDGAYFGATFPHLFLMTYPAVVPQPPAMVYVPRVFGFRIHKDAKRDSRDQVSTARQEAAEKMEQLSISKRKAADKGAFDGVCVCVCACVWWGDGWGGGGGIEMVAWNGYDGVVGWDEWGWRARVVGMCGVCGVGVVVGVWCVCVWMVCVVVGGVGIVPCLWGATREVVCCGAVVRCCRLCYAEMPWGMVMAVCL